ncbi:hypothetical protein [Mesorhizobium helmanticense]|uniref:hypothetical protein n=1 Tax=Mesorhizobium helmanticense TaxID=1776423 RepID=UPI000D1F497F|nr:hypothetical protein [Mesorhizobium helmanticense]
MVVTKPLIKGVTLVVYAKTSARIRFEVRHNLSTHSSHIGGTHTSEDLNQIISWLEQTTTHAAEQLNKQRQYLIPAQSRPFRLSDAADFFEAFAAWEGDAGTKERVMSLIISLGSYAGISGPDAGLIEHLVRRGVLTSGAWGARSVHSRFSGVINQLRHSPAMGGSTQPGRP